MATQRKGLSRITREGDYWRVKGWASNYTVSTFARACFCAKYDIRKPEGAASEQKGDAARSS